MSAFTRGFANELEKLGAPHKESGMDVVMAEAFGPIPSMVTGYKQQGVKGALKGGGGYIAGGGLGALAGLAAARLISRAAGGRDPGYGSFRASTVLPALGAVFGGLKGAAFAKLGEGFAYITPRTVRRLAASRGLDDKGEGFERFAKKVTGESKLTRMSQHQLHSLVRKLSGPLF